MTFKNQTLWQNILEKSKSLEYRKTEKLKQKFFIPNIKRSNKYVRKKKNVILEYQKEVKTEKNIAKEKRRIVTQNL